MFADVVILVSCDTYEPLLGNALVLSSSIPDLHCIYEQSQIHYIWYLFCLATKLYSCLCPSTFSKVGLLYKSLNSGVQFAENVLIRAIRG